MASDDFFAPGGTTHQRNQVLRRLLWERDWVQLSTLAARQRRVLSFLTALSYSDEPLLSWRAVEAMGVAAARIADTDPESVRVHLRRLMWLLNDESGGIGWRAPEMMAEIVYHRPRLFSEFVPIIISILDMEEQDVIPFRAGTLWALGRLAQVFSLDTLQPALVMIWDLFGNEPARNLDSQTLGMAVWCLGQGCFVGVADTPRIVTDTVSDMRLDQRKVICYLEGQLVSLTLAQLAMGLKPA